MTLCHQPIAQSGKLLWIKVADAVVAVYQAKRDWETAKAQKADNVEQYQVALIAARTTQRDATRALEEHAKSHGCKPG